MQKDVVDRADRLMSVDHAGRSHVKKGKNQAQGRNVKLYISHEGYMKPRVIFEKVSASAFEQLLSSVPQR